MTAAEKWSRVMGLASALGICVTTSSASKPLEWWRSRVRSKIRERQAARASAAIKGMSGNLMKDSI